MSNQPRKKRPADFNQRAFQIVQEATGEAPADPTPIVEVFLARGEDSPIKDPHAVEMGKKGGRKGGLKRASNLSPERRSEIARKAAKTRWGKEPA